MSYLLLDTASSHHDVLSQSESNWLGSYSASPYQSASFLLDTIDDFLTKSDIKIYQVLLWVLVRGH